MNEVLRKNQLTEPLIAQSNEPNANDSKDLTRVQDDTFVKEKSNRSKIEPVDDKIQENDKDLWRNRSFIQDIT